MNPDDFEQRLKRQPPRQLPPEWREEILRPAHEAKLTHHVSRFTFPSLLSTLNPLARRSQAQAAQLSTLLWPSPKAWAALAAVWVVILGVNFSLRDKTEVIAGKTPPSPEMIVALRQREELMAELMGQASPLEAEPPKTTEPRPRSALQTQTELA